MTHPSRRDRRIAERNALRARRRRSLTVGTLSMTAAVGAVFAGVAPASANEGSQPATSYQDWSYQGESSGSGYESSAASSDYSTDYSSDYSSTSTGTSGSSNSSSQGATYQLVSYSSSSSGSYGAAVNWATATAADPSVSYSYGGNGPTAYDCSGFTQNALAQSGVELSRTSASQYAGANQYVGLDELQVGDLVFWSNNGSSSGIYHVALYIGDGKIAHARNYSEGVSVTDVDYSPWNMMGTAARY